jgi:hypothetical protein
MTPTESTHTACSAATTIKENVCHTLPPTRSTDRLLQQRSNVIFKAGKTGLCKYFVFVVFSAKLLLTYKRKHCLIGLDCFLGRAFPVAVQLATAAGLVSNFVIIKPTSGHSHIALDQATGASYSERVQMQ